MDPLGTEELGAVFKVSQRRGRKEDKKFKIMEKREGEREQEREQRERKKRQKERKN
mgnify:CR=1 FL=1